MVRLYMDVHVPMSITRQLTKQGRALACIAVPEAPGATMPAASAKGFVAIGANG